MKNWERNLEELQRSNFKIEDKAKKKASSGSICSLIEWVDLFNECIEAERLPQKGSLIHVRIKRVLKENKEISAPRNEDADN